MDQRYLDIVAAYKKWVSLFPKKEFVREQEITYRRERRAYTFVEAGHWDGNCCTMMHFSQDTGAHLADDLVCDRERAWRDYIRIRDGASSLYA